MSKQNKRLLIIGGVAAGASCAARARRISEDAEIVIFEQGPYVSFANCGLPYYVGNKIKSRNKLLMATPERFKQWFNIDVRTGQRVTGISGNKKEIAVLDIAANREYTESYDALLLAPGSIALKPPLPGIDLDGIFTIKNIPDSEAISDWILKNNVKDAVVLGGGFIGCEMAENLLTKGIKVHLVEMLDQLMPQVDADMAFFIHSFVRKAGIDLKLGARVTDISRGSGNELSVALSNKEILKTGLVICAAGVKPDTTLAKNAGLEIGSRGGIRVNEFMQTSDPCIWAAGDAVESSHLVGGNIVLLQLAGPANRQGRTAADAIMGDNPSPFRGVQGTFICGIAGLTIASTGLSEHSIKMLEKDGVRISYEKIHLNPLNHAVYFPGARFLMMKLIFSKPDGAILGAQAIGTDGVDKRIDVISMAIKKKGSVYDLEDAELCYAPQYGSAKDPVNMAGMIAVNTLRKLVPVCHWNGLPEKAFVLDVRTKGEYENGFYPGAVNIPLHKLRKRINELPAGREIFAYCKGGYRSYIAARILIQKGFGAYSISGGYTFYPGRESAADDFSYQS